MEIRLTGSITVSLSVFTVLLLIAGNRILDELVRTREEASVWKSKESAPKGRGFEISSPMGARQRF